MERIELVKEIKDINIINLIQISVDDNLTYLKKEEGINVIGTFDVNGLYLNGEGKECNIYENVKVDMNVMYENIISRDEFKVYVDDFDYMILDGNLMIRVYVKFDSYKDVETTFPSSTVLEEKDSEPFIYKDEEKEIESDSILIVNEKDEEIPLPFLERFFESNKYEKSACFHVLKENETIEDLSKLYNVDVSELRCINKATSYQKGDLINIPLK